MFSSAVAALANGLEMEIGDRSASIIKPGTCSAVAVLKCPLTACLRRRVEERQVAAGSRCYSDPIEGFLIYSAGALLSTTDRATR